MTPRPMDKSQLQTVTLEFSDGTSATFTGPYQIAVPFKDSALACVRLVASPPCALEKGLSFEELNKEAK